MSSDAPGYWRRAHLGEVATLFNGRASGSGGTWLRTFKTRHVYDGLVRLTDPVFAPDERARSVPAETHLRPGDTLTPNMAHGTIGRVAYVREAEANWTVDGQIMVIRPRHDVVIGRYLFDWMSRPESKRFLVGLEKGGAFDELRGQTHIYRDEVARLPILVPPLSEQRKIAAILSAMDDAIEATQAVIDQLEVLKAALMDELLTRGLPGRHTRFKRTEIGELPESWDTCPLSEVIAHGPDNGLYKPKSEYGDGARIVRIDSFDNGDRITVDRLRRVRLSSAETARYQLRPNDILINRVNSVSHIAKAAFVGRLPEPTVFESNMMRLSVDDSRILPTFAFRVISSPTAKAHFVGRAKQAVAQASVNQGDVRELVVPVPPVAEQAAISSVAEDLDTRLSSEGDSHEGLIALKAALMMALLTGELPVASDEVAA